MYRLLNMQTGRRWRLLIGWLGLAVLLGVMLAPMPASADATSTWTGGPGAILDNTYDGYIDRPSANANVANGNFAVTGWFVDKTAEGWAGADAMQVFLGAMDGGGKKLTDGVVAESRPDVAAATGNAFWAASGFSATIPSGSLSAGNQVLSVYLHTGGKGWWYKQVSVNVTSAAPASSAPAAAPSTKPSGAALPIVGIEKPKDGEQVPTRSSYDIIGYALDKAAAPNQGVAGSGVDRVQVYVDNERDNGGTYLGDATLGYSDSAAAAFGPQFTSAGWRLTFKPTNFHANSHLIYAYARSAVSGKEDLAVRYFSIKD
ncbi:MAG: hypothetical protein JOY61_00150 [Chloroflexi bacterium]|nr:hypothetical protein [Chloroflexota bacterium]